MDGWMQGEDERVGNETHIYLDVYPTCLPVLSRSQLN